MKNQNKVYSVGSVNDYWVKPPYQKDTSNFMCIFVTRQLLVISFFFVVCKIILSISHASSPLFFNASWLDSETQNRRRSIPKTNACRRQILPCLFRHDRLLSLHVLHMARTFYYGYWPEGTLFQNPFGTGPLEGPLSLRDNGGFGFIFVSEKQDFSSVH